MRDQRTPDHDDIAALLLAVAAADITAPTADTADAAAGHARYLGEVVEIAFNGDDEQRIALIARLLAIARVTLQERHPDLDPVTPLRRLERMLVRWERERRSGAVRPRPRPQELEERVAMFGNAHGAEPLVGVDVVAMAVAELVAIHTLAGPTSVEEGIRCVGEVEPLVEAAAALLRGPGDELAAGVYERPGATLAHVDHAAWQLDQLGSDLSEREEILWARALWLELAAALVFALDAYDHAPDHAARWREVQQLAVEKMTLGGLRARPRDYDLDGALALVRSAALWFAGAWLDEARGSGEQPTAPVVAERLLDGAARALLASWAVGRRLGESLG